MGGDPARWAALPARARTLLTLEVNMFVLVRAVTYATLFIGLVLIYVPDRLLSWSGIVRPAAIELQQVAGIAIGVAGAAVALWCIFTFASIGRGTPAPFDPPRRLVIQGPYGFVRNPMYIGAGLALAGAALFYESLPLLGYTILFFLATHAFVVWYEEPTLRRTFGQEYEAYCRQVRRWWPSV
ncbi:MAG TPA: isoprenylcysteine carboxylmethyltransferase family protein [Bacteroidetes bacterium]|nr:isoprenylcysteine carboxylmethyltransferase family protein [Bacteroidota bacterium]